MNKVIDVWNCLSNDKIITLIWNSFGFDSCGQFYSANIIKTMILSIGAIAESGPHEFLFRSLWVCYGHASCGSEKITTSNLV